jgi:2-polyprenyl-6-methoxyphenol hydroxylase-like FAD-dependent oxidoreductase
LELLYTRLPEQQTRILTGKKVVSIETKADGVKVLCSDGTSEEGSLVIGCDGVHSPVRGMMRALAAKTSSPLPDPEAPMRARYHALAFHVRPCVEPWEPGHMWEVRDGKYCMQFFMYEKEGVVGVFRGRPSPTDKYTRYTDEDVDAFANEIMDHPVKKDVKIKDLWEARTWAAMVNLEEGMLKQWHWDRIVLLGDSAHKMTPHAGLGLNQGWQGVVALTNILRRLLGTTPNPDTALLTSALQQYQRGAESAAKSAMFLSKLYHRVVSWHNRGWKMMDLATPYLGGDKAVWRFLCWPLVKRSLILDDIQEPRHRIGTVKWDNQSVERKVGPAEEVRATS